MVHLSVNELLLYGGLAVMALSLVLALICIAVFVVTGRKIKRRLEQEYGKAMR